MKVLSCMCIEDVSEVLFLVFLLISPAVCCCHSKSIVVTHIKSDQRLGRFDDLLILAAKHAAQNVSAVFWPLYCHTMPPQGNVMGGQVWPQWKSFSTMFPTSTAEGTCMGVQCERVESECQKRCLWCGLCFTTAVQDKSRHYFIIWHRHDASSATWQWPRYHFPLLDPFVNISVYSWCGGVNIKFCFLYKQPRSATKEVEQVYTQDVCSCPAESVTCPHQVDLTNLCLPAAGLSGLCLKTMFPTITVK